MKKPMATELYYKLDEGWTRWCEPDHRHCLHVRVNRDLYSDYFSDIALDTWGKAAIKWCKTQWGENLRGRMGGNGGSWSYAKDFKLFVFKTKEQAMMFKMVWAAWQTGILC